MRTGLARAAMLPSLLCALGVRLASADEFPTFSKDVAPILRAKCQECHRPGQVGPFPLATYEQARKRAADLVAVVKERRMPPWKPEPGFGPGFQQDKSLTLAEISTITRWVQAGSPPGDDRDLPPGRPFVEGWMIGTPDLILEPAEDFAIPASGPDLYRCFVIPTGLPTDMYVSAVEYRPGNRKVVHHLMAFVETAGAARTLDAADPGPGYSSYSGAGVEIVGDLGGWAPGNQAAHLPEGVGRSLPRNSDVILQVHYHPSGKPETDRTRIGLHFSRKPVRQTLQWKGVMSEKFRLPAGEADIQVKASWFVPVAVDLLAVAPHMHRLGRDMKMTVSYPDGSCSNLIHVPDWDPDWQGTYTFVTPIHLPRGASVRVVGRYDNSERPGNPHSPPKLVKFGHGSMDEMCVGYVAVVKSGQDLTRPGEKDDLFSFFVEQYWRGIKRDQLNRIRR
jgi:Copper type II ascorbate-dependent monooxygenase, C-terminal domain